MITTIKTQALCSVLAALLAGNAQGAIAFVQVKTANTAATNASTLAITMDATPTAGNILVVAACSTGDIRLSMQPQAGIAWSAYSRVQTANGVTTYIITGRVNSNIASASMTLAADSTQALTMVVGEYSTTNGLRVDKQVSATSTGTAAASGATETTSTAGQLWVGCVGHRNQNGATLSLPTTNGTGGTPTIRGQTSTSNNTANNDRTVGLFDEIVTATGTANMGCTISASGVWVAMAQTYEEVTAGTTTAATNIPSISGR